jgi:transcriptional regulator with XRE-family HTH domain
MKAKDLAKELGVSTAYLSKIEKGLAEPSVEIIGKYATIFKTTPSSIMLFSEKMDKEKQRGPFKVKIRNTLFHMLQALENLKRNANEPISNK